MNKAKEIIAHYLNVNSSELSNSTKMDYTVISSSLMLHRMYSSLADAGYIVEDPPSVTTFADFVSAIENSSEKEVLLSVLTHQSIEYDSDPLAKCLDLGIDMEDISNFQKTDDYKDDSFYRDNFSDGEITYCESRHDPRASFAGLFSLKESIVKADNAIKGIPFKDINIVHDDKGKPIYDGYSLSMSHTKNFVISIAIKDNLDESFSEYHSKTDIEKLIESSIKLELNNYYSKKKILTFGLMLFFIFGLAIFVYLGS